MRVSLAPDVFADSSAFSSLVRLIDAFARGQHDLITDPKVTDVAVRYLTEHAPVLAGTYATLAPKGTVATAWTPAPEAGPILTVCGADLADHASDLCREAIVVVEDKISDGHFLRAICTAFQAERLLSALRNRWLTIVHSGGAERLPEIAKEEARRFSRLKRVAVLLDSDRLTPDAPAKHQAKADTLRTAGVTVHVLTFREAENYVPNRILAGLSPQRKTHQKIDHLKRLNHPQRAHFDMKHGFNRTDGISDTQRALYEGLDPATVRGLREGFGAHILEQLEAHSGALTEHDFATLGDEVVAELKALLHKLTSII